MTAALRSRRPTARQAVTKTKVIGFWAAKRAKATTKAEKAAVEYDYLRATVRGLPEDAQPPFWGWLTRRLARTHRDLARLVDAYRTTGAVPDGSPDAGPTDVHDAASTMTGGDGQ